MKTLERSYTTNSAEETRQLGRTLGTKIKTGAILLLSGNLGSGKTVFVQGLADGMETPPDCYVTSPTYAIINEYPAKLPFFHVDLFRLNDGNDLEDIGLMELLSASNVVAIEWPERLHPSELPSEYCKIEIESENQSIRTIRIIAYGLRMIDLIKEMPRADRHPCQIK